jgi:hypothetical protein
MFEIPTGPTVTQDNVTYNVPQEEVCHAKCCVTSMQWGSVAYDCEKARIVLRQLHELIQADFAKNHLKALKCFVEVDLLKCDRLLSQL